MVVCLLLSYSVSVNVEFGSRSTFYFAMAAQKSGLPKARCYCGAAQRKPTKKILVRP